MKGGGNTRKLEKKEEEGERKSIKSNKGDYCCWVKTDLDVIPPAQT